MHSYKQYTTRHSNSGFTIIELLIVIVVIGILAAITIISFNGVSQRANNASLSSDLTNAATKLGMYRVENDAYPISNDCTTGQNPAPPKICLSTSGANVFSSYIVDTSIPGAPHYKLVATNGSSAFYVTDLQGPTKTALISVSGGTETTDGAYTIRTFTSSGTFTVTGGTLTNVSALVIGGGGGGGVASGPYSAGGGGGGQFLELSGLSVSSGATTVTVGAGGALGMNGGVSSFGTNNAIGGGGGAATFGVGNSGANGGGGGMAGRAGGVGTAGFNGGNGGSYAMCGGGEPGSGGGAGGVGQDGGACIGGQGGIGKASSITGTSVYYAGGGSVESVASLGGGGGWYPIPAAGTPNTGGGGARTKPGGSGVVIVRYLTP